VRIQRKFYLVVSVLIAAAIAVGGVAVRGAHSLENRAGLLYTDNLQTSALTSTVLGQVDAADQVALRMLLAPTPKQRQQLAARLQLQAIPAIDRSMAALQRIHRGDPPSERALSLHAQALWLTARQQLFALVAGHTTPASADMLSAAFTPLSRQISGLSTFEDRDGAESYRDVSTTYDSTVWLIVVAGVLAALACLAATTWLGRTVVRRTLSYSRLAGLVADGELTTRVQVSGSDELADLGHTLNVMVDRQQAGREHERAQNEFAESLQQTESEDEAHDLLRRHLERSIPHSRVVVLNRNNSDDRLEPRTPLADDSTLAQSLRAATPRSCLAVRFARAHQSGPGTQPLIDCPVCGGQPGQQSCRPLLVGGQVIGSVLIGHETDLDATQAGCLRESVSQAAPVIGNMRTLALAEQRAATDALTGLPNSRAAQDTLRRMVAQAARTGQELTVALIDLDHFKRVNDTYGHPIGDDVLAAVGATLKETVRESDFTARLGGEEFLALFPATDIANGKIAAEALRVALSNIKLRSVEWPITASIGLAASPAHAVDATGVLRLADRALYTAKSNGRNRIETIKTERRASPPRPRAARTRKAA
jgi:diguanylate cyclase (GGDEF)-like protein